jgi:hypothetical protein
MLFSLETGSTIPNACVLLQITWVYRPRNHRINGIRWLPLYANARRLTQNNPRSIVDYTGYNEQTKRSLSILTIHQLKASDEGIYMCKSNQYQSHASLYNLTLSRRLNVHVDSSFRLFFFLATMQIQPKEQFLLIDRQHSWINLSCTVHETSHQQIDPLRIKWYRNQHEVEAMYFIEKPPHSNQATLIITIPQETLNDADIFKCIYDNGKASKDVHIVSSASAGK